MAALPKMHVFSAGFYLTWWQHAWSIHRFYPLFHYFQLGLRVRMRSSVIYYQIDNINIDWISYSASVSFWKLNHTLLNESFSEKDIRLNFSRGHQWYSIPIVERSIFNDKQSFRFVSAVAIALVSVGVGVICLIIRKWVIIRITLPSNFQPSHIYHY